MFQVAVDNRLSEIKRGVSGAVRDVRSRPLKTFVLILCALGFYSLGSLNALRRGFLSDCGIEHSGIAGGVKQVLKIPPASKYEELLKSTASKWLSPWENKGAKEPSISTEMVDNLWLYMLEHGSSCASFRVKVVNHALTWPPTLMQQAAMSNIYYMPRVQHWKRLFDELARVYGLPEYLDMVISIQDDPKILKRVSVDKEMAPLFSYTTTAVHADIPLPSTEYYEKADNFLPEELEERQKWDERIPKAIWRGSPTGGEYTIANFWSYARTHLVNLTRANSDVLDAKFLPCAPGQCSEQTFKAMQDAGLPSDTKHFSFGEYLGYKYLIDIDGNAWSSRYPHVLACGAVFFKAASPYTEYFYEFLTPNEDYIPIASDASDLPKKLRYALEHDDEMRLVHERVLEKHSKLIGNGNWLKYVHFLLTKYSSLLERPKIPPDEFTGNSLSFN